MNTVTKLGLVAGAIMMSAAVSTQASARIVCEGDDCWHAKEVYEYPAGANVVIHEDGWAAGPGVRWREHEGRGFWRGDRWEDF